MSKPVSGRVSALLWLSCWSVASLSWAADEVPAAVGSPAAEDVLDEFLPPSAPKAAEVSDKPADGTFSVPANVISLQDSMVSAEIAANIEQINVDVGDKVNRGDELARLDCREFTIREEQAQADLNTLQVKMIAIQARIDAAKNELAASQSSVSLSDTQTRTAQDNVASAQAELNRVQAQTRADQAQCQLAVQEVKRARELRQRQVIAQQDLDKAEAVFRSAQAMCNAIQPQIASATAKLNAMKSAVNSSQVAVKVQQAKARVSLSNIKIIEAEIPALKAQVAAAQARVKTEQLMVSRCQLRAPFAGEVVKRIVQIGQRIGIGENAFQIISTTDKEVMASLNDDELAALDKAKQVFFKTPDERYPVKFRAAVPVVSGAARTREVRFTLDEQNNLAVGKTGRIIWEAKP